jgi:hypothetical protein
MGDAIINRQYDDRPLVAVNELTGSETNDAGFPSRACDYEHAPVELSRIGSETRLDIFENPILNQLALSIGGLSLIS